MQLTDEHIASFQTLYAKNFHVELTRDEAVEKGSRIVRLVKAVITHQSKPTEQYDSSK